MKNMYQKILNQDESYSRDTICYSLGTLCNAAASMVVLLIVTRIMGQDISGIFSLGWSAAQLMLTIGWFSTRQYQVSDINEKIGFYEYCIAKFISAIVMIGVGFVYVRLFNYDDMSAKITILLCILLTTEVFADLFGGFFQQNGKLYIGGISYTVRNLTYLTIFTITLMRWRNLEWSIVCAFFVVVIWFLIFDFQLVRRIPRQNKSCRIQNVCKIYIDCFPLFIGSFVTSFIMNIPKNAINKYMDYASQANYNILFMPTSVINMFNMFICVPYYVRLAEQWNGNKRDEFLKTLYKLATLLLGITVVTLLGAAVLGIPVLSWLYNVDLSDDKLAFLILILGGGFYGFISLMTYVITVFRRQQIILYVYVVCAAIAQLGVSVMVKKFGMMGAALTYTMTLGVVCLVMMAYIRYYLSKYNYGGDSEVKEQYENKCDNTGL